MITSLISATTWYVDVALVAVLVLFLVGGIIKGFGKSFKGFFMSIIIVLGALLLMGAFHATVMDTNLSANLQAEIASASVDWGDEFTGIVFISDNGSYCLAIEGELVALSSLGIKGKIANWLAKMFIAESGKTSIAGVCVYNITSLIFAAGLFIVAVIALTLICTIIKGATKNMHTSGSTAVKAIDRTLGAVIGLAIGIIIVFLVLAIFAALKDKAPQIVEYIEQSKICKFFYELNPIGKVFAKIFTKQ